MFEPGETESSPQSGPARPSSPSLSEISHLFLSTVREKTEGGTRPHRRPPGQHMPRPSASIDLTPAEFEKAFAHEDALRLDPNLDTTDDATPLPETADVPREAEMGAAGPRENVCAVLAGHLGAQQREAVRTYARRLAADNKRVGLIEVDAAEFRLTCFDGHAHSEIDHAGDAGHLQLNSFDARVMSEALNEMAWDIEQWLIALPAMRMPEANALLRSIDNWTLLSTSDHEGVVSAYRTMKGAICEMRSMDGDATPERISLAVLDGDAQTSERVHKKLSTVCDEFLACHIEREPGSANSSAKVAEHLVMCCVSHRDKGQSPCTTQWQVLASFIVETGLPGNEASTAADTESMTTEPTDPPVKHAQPTPTALRETKETMPMSHLSPFATESVDNVVSAEESRHFKEPLPETATPVETHASIPMPLQPQSPPQHDDVIDLVGGDSSEAGIIASVMRRGFGAGHLIECPIAPPMRGSAKLAVTRQRRLTLVAVARQGLSDLRSIGETYRWLVENRSLIAMALPQMSIDAHAMPHLNLLIDQSDTSADLLQPIVSASHVTVRAYRTLRWAGRTGLLLEAA